MQLKFRKRPVVIEAFQMTPERREDNRDWPEWLNQAWQMNPSEVGSVYPLKLDDGLDESRSLMVRTLEGPLAIGWGDWIIRGVKNELYPCKPDVFTATYEAVE